MYYCELKWFTTGDIACRTGYGCTDDAQMPIDANLEASVRTFSVPVSYRRGTKS